MSEAPRIPRFSWRVLAVSTGLALAAAGITVVVLSDDDDPGPASIELTPSGDAVTFTTFEGDTVDLASLQGKPVIVNFFQSTCVPCITEMPAFEEVHQDLGDEVTFLGLAFVDRPDDALDLIERTGVTYRTAQDKDGSVMESLGGTMLPTTVLLDADGEIVGAHAGQLSADELRAAVADELGIDA